jgi:opacity protein-like surface antigen
VGVYLNYLFCERAGFYTKADVGGFDVSAKLTWQVEGGFDFPFAEHWYARLAYRCLSSDFERERVTLNATMRGPQVEIGVRF